MVDKLTQEGLCSGIHYKEMYLPKNVLQGETSLAADCNPLLIIIVRVLSLPSDMRRAEQRTERPPGLFDTVQSQEFCWVWLIYIQFLCARIPRALGDTKVFNCASKLVSDHNGSHLQCSCGCCLRV